MSEFVHKNSEVAERGKQKQISDMVRVTTGEGVTDVVTLTGSSLGKLTFLCK